MTLDPNVQSGQPADNASNAATGAENSEAVVTESSEGAGEGE